jgi:membrane fusion protein, macrolide-specific efflux system
MIRMIYVELISKVQIKAAWYAVFVFLMPGVLVLSGCSNKKQQVQVTVTPFPTTSAMARTTYVVERGDVLNQVELSGRIVPVEQQDIYFQSNGRVRHVYIKNGDMVKQGQVLADLEGIDDIQRIQALKDFELDRVKIHADNARLSLELFKLHTPTFTRGYSETLQLHLNELALAEIAVQESMLGNLDVQMAISDTLLLAPMDGKITWLYLREGNEIQAYQAVGIVSDVDQLEAGLNIAGETQRKIEQGMEVVVKPRRNTGETLQGTVRWVFRGFVDEGVGDDTVRITLDKAPQDAGYKVNDQVDVIIVLDRSDNTLWLPPYAIRKFEGRTFVVVQEGELQRRVDVRLGVVGEDRVEIIEGLEEGQTIIGQ